jgi:hypothetical protein
MAVVDFLFGNAEGCIDKTAVWTAILAFITLILVVVAWYQLSSIRKTTRADYLKRLNDSFFTEETRNLLVLLFNSAIEFATLPIKNKDNTLDIDELPYFRIDEVVLKQLTDSGLIYLPSWRKGYNAFEIDDLLLGPLDDVGRFEKNGLLDISAAYRTFGYYVCELVGDNEAVKGYLKYKDSQGNYDDLLYLHKKFLSYKNKGNQKKEDMRATETHKVTNH